MPFAYQTSSIFDASFNTRSSLTDRILCPSWEYQSGVERKVDEGTTPTA
ncbi:MAG: hypothetical protein KDD32_13040 [Bacteroidetes bacterium]|nr:hypothetical protein [Bacteroidota bacterium]